MTLKWVVVGLSIAVTGFCSDVWTGTVTITGTESAKTDRIYRNGVASTWVAPKAFPGLSACGTSSGFCHFRTVTLPPTDDQYIRITTYTGQPSNAPPFIFGSAYNNMFSTANLSQNYLGDPGASSGTQVFEVILPFQSQLVLAFNSVYDGDIGSSISYKVETFYTQNELNKQLFESFFFN